MAEAAEVAAWRSFDVLVAHTDGGGNGLTDLVQFTLPLQQRHLELALEGAGMLGRTDAWA